MICQSEPTRERVKVSHVEVECRVINHHPINNVSPTLFDITGRPMLGLFYISILLKFEIAIFLFIKKLVKGAGVGPRLKILFYAI